MNVRKAIATLALLGLLALPGVAQAAPAPAPAPKVLAISAPTNLPPKQSEVQRLTVEAQGGTFKLTFGGEETAAIAFDASPEALQGALEAVPAIGAGTPIVSGGPGGDAGHPYFIAFKGSKANQDVEALTVLTGSLSGEHAFAHVATTVPGGAGTGKLIVLPSNVGGLPTSPSVPTQVHLGPLPAGVLTSGPAKGTEWDCPGSAAGQSELTCITTKTIPSVSASPYPIVVPVEVSSETPLEEAIPVTAKGGGGSLEDTFQLPIVVSPEPAPPGLAAIWAGSYEADGSPAAQAGGHPFSAASYVMFNTTRNFRGEPVPVDDGRDVLVDLQPGFIGNPLATKRCPQDLLLEPAGSGYQSPFCTREMSVGTLIPFIGDPTQSISFEGQGLFNDVPPNGYAAGFSTKLKYPIQTVLASVRSETDYGVRISAFNNANFEKLFGAFAAFEGTPREGTGQALLTNSSDCAEQARQAPVLGSSIDTWQNPGTFIANEDVPLPPVTGCDALQLHPSFSMRPTSNQGSSPVGATAHLHLPDAGLTDPEALAEPQLKKAVVKLPAGLVLNPAQANGLQACSEAQIGYKGPGALPNPTRFSDAPVACPDGSKLGSVEAVSPLLEEPLRGTIYLAAQEENPFHTLIGIYLVLESPRFGLRIKLPGRVDPDPATGQLTATFDYNPQLPLGDLTLNFRGGGPRSELATPEVCGTYHTRGSWEPWSAPESGPPAQTDDAFEVQEGCAESAAERFFEPGFEAGTAGTQAGGHAPLVIKVSRQDGEQELRSLDFALPPGLTGKLAGIATCGEAEIAAAQAKSGRQEQASASCPAASRLGSVDTAAGVGPEPFHVQGGVYLAGPYEGAPVSTVVITPALAGPFDLGNVVIRAPIYVDPETAQLTVKSDPLPTILKGIPLKLRTVAIDIDRQGFILNPTDCEPMRVSASMGGGSGATYDKRNRFQVGGCDKLGFKPHLKLSLKGGTKRNGHPALTAVLNQPEGGANIASLSVALPHSEFLEQAHIRTICTRVQFNEGAGGGTSCPAGSVYGSVRAWSPLVDYVLEGPVFLRASSNKLPDLVAVVRGPASQPIVVAQAGRIDSVRGGIRNSFEVFPDVPISKVVLQMQGGKKGLLVNSTDICRGNHRATVKFTAQNGDAAEYRQKLQAKCGGKKGKKAKRHRARHRRPSALSRLSAIW